MIVSRLLSAFLLCSAGAASSGSSSEANYILELFDIDSEAALSQIRAVPIESMDISSVVLLGQLVRHKAIDILRFVRESVWREVAQEPIWVSFVLCCPQEIQDRLSIERDFFLAGGIGKPPFLATLEEYYGKNAGEAGVASAHSLVPELGLLLAEKYFLPRDLLKFSQISLAHYHLIKDKVRSDLSVRESYTGHQWRLSLHKLFELYENSSSEFLRDDLFELMVEHSQFRYYACSIVNKFPIDENFTYLPDPLERETTKIFTEYSDVPVIELLQRRIDPDIVSILILRKPSAMVARWNPCESWNCMSAFRCLPPAMFGHRVFRDIVSVANIGYHDVITCSKLIERGLPKSIAILAAERLDLSLPWKYSHINRVIEHIWKRDILMTFLKRLATIGCRCLRYEVLIHSLRLELTSEDVIFILSTFRWAATLSWTENVTFTSEFPERVLTFGLPERTVFDALIAIRLRTEFSPAMVKIAAQHGYSRELRAWILQQLK